jgi:alpha-beta hydrolase superfamily lysophospholipase
MLHNTSEFNSFDGLKLFSQSWETDESIADLILVHGLGEHSGRYEWVANKCNENRISVHSFDLRGHGKSEGERAFVNSFDQYLEDLHSFIEIIGAEKKVFLFGHSMGGLIVVNYLLKYPDTACKGALLSAAALKIGDDIPQILVGASSILSILLPRLKSKKVDPKLISRDSEVVSDYENDTLIFHDGVKARLGAGMIKSMLEVRKQYPQFELPVLLMHGTGDKLADPLGSQWMFDEISSKDKSLEILPGLYHEILNEPEKEEVISKMLKWILDRA